METLILFASSTPAYVVGILGAVLVLAVCFVLFQTTKKPLQNLLERQGIDIYVSRVIVFSIYRTILYCIGIITALSQLGINIVAAMTGFGIVGIAVGFAAKDALANVIAGFMIFWDKPFRVGDWVEVDGHYGKIHAMSLRSTRIHTRSNFHIIIPNQIIANTTVINHHSKRRVRTTAYLDVPYDSDLDQAQKILKKAAGTIDRVLDDPKPGSGISKLDGGRATLAILVWTKNAQDAIGIDAKIRDIGKKALDKAGFGIPYEYNISNPKKRSVKK